MKRSGVICKLEDGRTVIVYQYQPLKSAGKIVCHLVDEEFNLMLNEAGKERTILRESDSAGRMKIIGYID